MLKKRLVNKLAINHLELHDTVKGGTMKKDIDKLNISLSSYMLDGNLADFDKIKCIIGKLAEQVFC